MAKRIKEKQINGRKRYVVQTDNGTFGITWSDVKDYESRHKACLVHGLQMFQPK